MRGAVLHPLLHGKSLCVVKRIHDHDLFERSLIPNAAYLLELLFAGNKNSSRARISQNISDLFRRERGIDGYDNGPSQQASKGGNGPFRPVFAEDRDTVSLPSSAF